MNDDDCVRFLQSALPRMHLRWAGFRRVRRQVRKRVERRVQQLGLPDLRAYESRLESDPDEWNVLDSLCRITISRFYRDRAVGDHIRDVLLPRLGHQAREREARGIRCWSAGCGSGEEPYTISLLWHLEVSPRFPELSLAVVATDADAAMIDRAEAALYKPSSLRNLPEGLRRVGFDPHEDEFRLRAEFQQEVEFRALDIRKQQPDGPFDLVLCRNLVFTYFDEELRRDLASRITDRLIPDGALVIGIREQLPPGVTRLVADRPEVGIYRKRVAG